MDKPGISNAGLSIDPVTQDDLPEFMALLSEYADSLRPSGSGPRFVNTEESISQALFSTPPVLEAVIARHEGKAAGLACWSKSYHVMSGRTTMEIKHIYVRPEHRRLPVAMLLARHIQRVAIERKYWRVEGQVGGWNKPVQYLYTMLKAKKLDHITFRIEEPSEQEPAP